MEPDEKRAAIEELREDSRTKLEAVSRAGIQEIPLGMARLEMLIEAILPWEGGTNEARLDLELRWETHANAILTQIVEQVTRATLLQGVNGVNLGPNGR